MHPSMIMPKMHKYTKGFQRLGLAIGSLSLAKAKLYLDFFTPHNSVPTN
jgi:hypothetical protein